MPQHRGRRVPPGVELQPCSTRATTPYMKPLFVRASLARRRGISSREKAMGSTTSSPPLRILIAEGHPIVPLGLADLLDKLGCELVGSVASGPEAILAAAAHHPNLMLIDVDLRGEMDGIMAAVEIHN